MAARTLESDAAADAPAGVADRFRITRRAEGGLRLDVRVPSPRGAPAAAALLVAGVVMLKVNLGPARAGATRIPDPGLLATAGLFAAVLGGIWLLWSLWSDLFPESWLVARDRLEIRRGFLLFPKTVAIFVAGPIEVVRTIIHIKGHKLPQLCVQIQAAFVGEPFSVYTGLEADTLWIARLLAEETSWPLFVTPDAGQPDLTNV